MKNLTIIILLVFTSLAQCQITANIISQTEYDNIEINGIKYIDLKNTLGEQNTVETLFGTANTIEKDDDPIYGGAILYIEFYYDGLDFGFSEGELGGFHITNSNSNITIQGITVTIGDNISVLGNVVFNTMSDGGKSIVYQYCDGCNNFISIRFNQLTNIITEIIYIEQT